MDWKELTKLLVSTTVAGLGVGFLIGRHEVHDMAAKCDHLNETNKLMQDRCERLEMVNDNLREANRWKTELLLKEAIDNDCDDVTNKDKDIFAEEAEQIVDEMSDEEYEETLAYIRDVNVE